MLVIGILLCLFVVNRSFCWIDWLGVRCPNSCFKDWFVGVCFLWNDWLIVCEGNNELEIVLKSGSDVYEWRRVGRGTVGMNGFLNRKDIIIVKGDSSERGYVCLWGWVKGSTLQSDDTRILEWSTVFICSEWSEFRQVYSSVHFTIITSHDQFRIHSNFPEPECILTKSNGSQFR